MTWPLGVFYVPKTTAGWGTGIPLAANPLGPNFPVIVNTVVTPAILDTLEKNGMTVNAGLTPPTLSGAYLISPAYCLFDNSGAGAAGTTLGDYEYEFTNQNNPSFSITVTYSDKIAGGNDSGTDTSATYISGTGNLFTVYAQTIGTENGIAYTSLQVISGQIVSGQINNFQVSEYLEAKGPDPNNELVPVGTTRIVEDQDGVSPLQSSFTFFHGPKTAGLLLRELKPVSRGNK